MIYDQSAWTMITVFTSFLFYSYYRHPLKVLCCFYILSSLLFVLKPLLGFEEPIVHAWFTFKIAAIVGMYCAEVVAEEMNKAYALIHLGTILFACSFGFHSFGGWIVYPLVFILMAAVSGYKRICAWSIPSLLIITLVSQYVYGVPFVSLCVPISMLLPFAFVCDLFPKDLSFDMV